MAMSTSLHARTRSSTCTESASLDCRARRRERAAGEVRAIAGDEVGAADSGRGRVGTTGSGSCACMCKMGETPIDVSDPERVKRSSSSAVNTAQNLQHRLGSAAFRTRGGSAAGRHSPRASRRLRASGAVSLQVSWHWSHHTSTAGCTSSTWSSTAASLSACTAFRRDRVMGGVRA